MNNNRRKLSFQLNNLHPLPLFSLQYRSVSNKRPAKKAAASRSYTIIVQKHAAGTTMFYSTVNSSTTATSRRDQTAVLYFSPFGSFFRSFLDKQKRTYKKLRQQPSHNN